MQAVPTAPHFRPRRSCSAASWGEPACCAPPPPCSRAPAASPGCSSPGSWSGGRTARRSQGPHLQRWVTSFQMYFLCANFYKALIFRALGKAIQIPFKIGLFSNYKTIPRKYVRCYRKNVLVSTYSLTWIVLLSGRIYFCVNS